MSTTHVSSAASSPSLSRGRTTKVFLFCSGLGHIRRGYESFTQECFEALSQEPALDLTLFKGGGKASNREIPLGNIPRNHPLATQIGAITEKLIGRGGPYWVEQTTFGFNLLPYVYLQKPDVVFFSDPNIGNILWHWRRLSKQNYQLLFSNGGPWMPPAFERWDHVQQLVPVHLEAAIALGDPPKKHSLVPYGIHMSKELQLLTSEERKTLRRQLGLPEQQRLLLSVAAINKYHKRADYVIREVASLPHPRPYLLLLGQQEAETPEIVQLGNELLGNDNFQIRTVGSSEVGKYYQVADAFVLASMSEGLARAYLEAMSYGLPCLTHDYEVTRFILENQGLLADLELPGNLAKLIPQAFEIVEDVAQRQALHSYTYERFSWDKLRPAYVDLITKCAQV